MELLWKPVGIGDYEISNYGMLRNKNKFGAFNLMKGSIKQGKITFQLTHDGKKYSKQAHVLVAKHFVEDLPYYCQIKMIDGNSLNIRADNLMYINKASKEQNYKIEQSNAEYFAHN